MFCPKPEVIHTYSSSSLFYKAYRFRLWGVPRSSVEKEIGFASSLWLKRKSWSPFPPTSILVVCSSTLSSIPRPKYFTMYSHHFSINNIPFGIASSSSHAHKSVATRLEDTVIFLDELASYYPELSKELIKTFSEVRKILYKLSSSLWLISSGNTQSLRRSP
jgi:hypothetical protein